MLHDKHRLHLHVFTIAINGGYTERWQQRNVYTWAYTHNTQTRIQPYILMHAM